MTGDKSTEMRNKKLKNKNKIATRLPRNCFQKLQLFMARELKKKKYFKSKERSVLAPEFWVPIGVI